MIPAVMLRQGLRVLFEGKRLVGAVAPVPLFTRNVVHISSHKCTVPGIHPYPSGRVSVNSRGSGSLKSAAKYSWNQELPMV